MNTKWAKQKGFTIVELLIVIVVIGILAAITVVAYNGIQAKTRNTARVAEAREYSKILELYRVTYGQYPFTTGRYCLGEGFPDYNGDGIGDCYNLDGISGWLTSMSAAVNTELKKIASTLPNNTRQIVLGDSGINRLGPLAIWKSDGFFYIFYFLEKPAATNCPFGEIEFQDSSTVICQTKLN